MTAPGSKTPRDTPDVITKPPFIFLAGLVAGLLLDLLIAGDFLISPVQYPLATALFTAGGAVLLSSLRRFRHFGTAVEPWKPSTALVTDGIYALTRNPIYLGAAAVYLGLGALFDNAWIILFLAPIMLVIHFGVVLPEERYLQRKFGTPYLRYKAGVRRWL